MELRRTRDVAEAAGSLIDTKNFLRAEWESVKEIDEIEKHVDWEENGGIWYSSSVIYTDYGSQVELRCAETNNKQNSMAVFVRRVAEKRPTGGRPKHDFDPCVGLGQVSNRTTDLYVHKGNKLEENCLVALDLHI